MNFNNICRTCTNNFEAVKITDTVIQFENESVSVLDVLGYITDTAFNENLPDAICLTCLKTVEDIYKFKLQCEKSCELLQNYTKDLREEQDNIKVTSPDNENDLSDLRQIIVQFDPDNSQSNKNSSDIKTEETRPESSFKGKCKKKHKSKLINDIQPICTICSKSFKSKYILSVHQKRHESRGQYLCNVCGKGFNSQGCLTRHGRVHTGEKKYECEVCHRKFPSSNNLKLHFRTHSGIKPYLCTICGKSFSHPTGLTYHMRTHTKEKPYCCEVCGKCFTIQCHVDRHRKIHTGERPFPCSQCEKAFIKKIDLQRHEAVHAGVKPYICSVCNKSFIRKIHLNYHVMVHTQERPHKCKVCGKGFIRKYYLRDHIAKHHSSSDFGGEIDQPSIV